MKQLAINTPENATDMVVVQSHLKDLFLSGDHEPLDVYARLKAAAEVIESVLKDTEVKQAVINEAGNYPEKTFEAHGATWTKKMGGVKYDYSACGDPTHDHLSQLRANLDKKVKQREAHLKTLPKDGEVITDQETGETTLVYPPAKTGSESISCKLN